MNLILSLLLTFIILDPGADQKTAQAPIKMIEFHMALLKKGPKWTTQHTKETEQMHQAHLARAASLLESGQAIIAGPLTDDGDIRGIYIFRASSAAEAKEWVDSDPAVASGHLIAEMHPWWSQDVMKKTATPLKTTTAYLAFLKRGAAWTPEQTPATEELQKAHIANIVRLNGLGKLVVAGPFGDEGELRGIFVFRVDTLAEAKALSDTDPAVKAGRLELELHPWQVPEGILP